MKQLALQKNKLLAETHENLASKSNKHSACEPGIRRKSSPAS